MSRLVSIDAMNKISYFLTYHSFLFYISKLLNVTTILYFLHSFSFSPRRRFVFQTEIAGKCIVLVLISLLFYFSSSLRRGDQSTVFCVVPFSLAQRRGQGKGPASEVACANTAASHSLPLLRVSHVVAGANERRLYSQAN